MESNRSVVRTVESASSCRVGQLPRERLEEQRVNGYFSSRCESIRGRSLVQHE